MMRLPHHIILIIFAVLILLPLLFCSEAAEQTSRHWLYGVEHKSWPGPVISGIVGAILVHWGSQRGEGSAYLGYLLLIVAVIGAFRLC